MSTSSTPLHVNEALQWSGQLYTSKVMRPDWRQPTASFAYMSARCGDALPELVALTKELRSLYGDHYVDEAASDATALASGVNRKLPQLLGPYASSALVVAQVKLLALLHGIPMDDKLAAAIVPGAEDDWVEITAPLPSRRVAEVPTLVDSIYACL